MQLRHQRFLRACSHKPSMRILERKDDPLSEKAEIDPEELWDKPLIVSRQAMCEDIEAILGKKQEQLNVVGTFNLLYNGSLMVEEGMGYALAFDKIINTTGDSPLCFRPFSRQYQTPMFVVWKKYQVFTKAAERFLARLKA